MDKKQLHALVDGMVEQVAEENNLEQTEARVFVGVALRQNREAFLRTVNVPTLELAQPKVADAA